MTVEVERNPNTAVTQALADDLYVRALAKHEARVGVTQVVEPEPPNVDGLRYPHPSSPDVRRIDGCPDRRGEYQPRIVIGGPDEHALFELLVTMFAEHPYCVWRDRHRASTLRCLRLPEGRPFARQVLRHLLLSPP